MTRQPTGRPRGRRKGRRRPVPPPAIARARVAPVGATTPNAAAEPKPGVARPKAPNPMDFRYVNAELRRILFFIVGMIALVVVLSFVLH